MSDKFDLHTRVPRLEKGFSAVIDPIWSMVLPAGGYLAAIALRAAGAATEKLVPLTASFEFASVAKPGPVDISVETITQHGEAELLRVVLRQDGRIVIDAHVWAGTPREGFTHNFAPPPIVNLPIHCPTLDEVLNRDGIDQRWPIFSVVDERPIDWNSLNSWRIRAPEQKAWFSYKDQSIGDVDDNFLAAARYLIPVDLLPWFAASMAQPVDLVVRTFGITLQLSVNFHAVDGKHQWLLAQARADLAGRGAIHGLCQLWSEQGEPLATAMSHIVCKAYQPVKGRI